MHRTRRVGPGIQCSRFNPGPLITPLRGSGSPESNTTARSRRTIVLRLVTISKPLNGPVTTPAPGTIVPAQASACRRPGRRLVNSRPQSVSDLPGATVDQP
eukprot:3739929-Rhodomonas_salina.2